MLRKPIETIPPVKENEIRIALLDGATPEELSKDYAIPEILIRKTFFDIIPSSINIKSSDSSDQNTKEKKQADEKHERQKELAERIKIFGKLALKEAEVSVNNCRALRDSYFGLLQEIELLQPPTATHDITLLTEWYEEFFSKAIPILKMDPYKNLFNVDIHNGFSEEQIKINYNRLRLIFHPDKTHLSICNGFFDFISQTKESLVNHKKCLKTLEELEKWGDILVVTAKDSVTRNEDLETAYLYYRNALSLIENNESDIGLSKRIELRIKIARLLVERRQYSHAQLYVLGGVRLLTGTFEISLTPLIANLQKLSRDIRAAITIQNKEVSPVGVEADTTLSPRLQQSPEKRESKNLSNFAGKSEQQLMLFDITAAALTSDSKNLSLGEKIQTLKRNVNRDIANLDSKQLERALVLSPDLFISIVNRSIVKAENMLERDKQIVLPIATGFGIGGLVTGGLASLSAFESAVAAVGSYGSVATVGVGSCVALGGILVSMGSLVLMFWGTVAITERIVGYYWHHEAKAVLKKFQEALRCHQEQKYPELLKILGEKGKEKRGIICFDPQKKLGHINVTTGTIKYLVDLQLPPDLISYVLLITAECYINRNVGDVKDLMIGRLRTEAIDILEKLIAARHDLEKQAEYFDDIEQASEESSSNFYENIYYLKRLMANIFGSSSTTNKLSPDSCSQRIRICIVFARINLALEHLLSTEEEQDAAKHIEIAKGHIKAVEDMLEETPQLRGLLDDRYNVVKDFLAILGHEKFVCSPDYRLMPEPISKLAILGPKDFTQEKIKVHLQSVRQICIVKDNRNNSHFCQVLSTPPDGNCGFNAIRQVLSSRGKFSDISREQFILEVKSIDAVLTKEDSAIRKGPFYRAWKPLVAAMYRDAKVDSFESWQEQFSKSGYWVNECHLRFLSKQHHIEFKLYKLDDESRLLSDEIPRNFIAYPQALHVINVTDPKSEKPIEKVGLLHIPLDSKLDAPLIHFEGLRVYDEPSEREIGEVCRDLNLLEQKMLMPVITLKDEKQRSACQTQLAKALWKKALLLNTIALKAEKLSCTPEALRHWQEASYCLEKIQKNKYIGLLDSANSFFPMLVQMYCHLRRYSQAMFILQDIDMVTTDKAVKAKLYYLQALVFIKLRKWEYVRGAISSAKRNGLEAEELKRIDMFATRLSEKYALNHQADIDFKTIITQRSHLLEKRYPTMESKSQEHSKDRDKENKYDSLLQPLHKSRRNVLSIEGGGIRGLVPCVILSEIEHRAHQPIANLFQVLAGTSTGAILSAGFSVLKPNREHYSADELLELYTTKREKIFKRKFKAKLFSEKYEESGLEEELQHYFGENKLTDCKTDLLVTSMEVKSRELRQFNSASARNDSRKDFYLKHILRASSAAPTFFKKFKWQDEVFIDGGMRANNPAQLALHYTEKNFGITASDIFLLSLGTGDYIPDPTEPYKNFSLLFWANPKNLSNIYSERVEQEVHSNMCHLFAKTPSQYRRLQPMMDRVVPLDASREEDIRYLLDLADEYVEELDASEDNTLNKIVESLTF